MAKNDVWLNGENPYEQIKQKTKRQWHMYRLCEDIEFIKSVLDTRELALRYNGEAIDDDELERHNKFVHHIQAQLATLWDITEKEFFEVYSESVVDLPFEIEPTFENNSVTIKIRNTINKTDYIHAWDYIERRLRIDEVRPRRKRAPEDTKLIYAISRSRHIGLAFTEIFKLYQNGDLGTYSGPTNQFDSKDKLERYYNKHKTDR
ncbi:MAG: hypothetical protein ACI9T8_000269 [Candidatus Saccharimonadales bacterium]|jgi:hypothetical protein